MIDIFDKSSIEIRNLKNDNVKSDTNRIMGEHIKPTDMKFRFYSLDDKSYLKEHLIRLQAQYVASAYLKDEDILIIIHNTKAINTMIEEIK